MRGTRLLAIGAALALCGCSAPINGAPRASASTQPIVYAAIGASETYGVGADDRARQAWPQLFLRGALPDSTAYYNFGIPGATTAQALRNELPPALAVHPTVATVWLNVNDLIQGIPASAYAADLRRLVRALRRQGKTRVLVASTPDLGQLQAYRACLPDPPPGGPACLIPAALLPSPQQLAAAIAGYNAAIIQVTNQEGATMVNLSGADVRISQHPDWISADGFHPNARGYAAIARAFEAAYLQGRPGR
jgi:lysophospholipase L1-like esterase